ncbi:hypothetical protein QYE76_067263 [Lolium multiflorum]|uniref:Uncharacterized protein n=1 Tax=Lolium multiflorum TaxID=4521 RepID=A0AAD8WAT4_LOLMU|nr:hypothetical protein QYE76_067263 [Lolium multiflorum]
MNPLSGVPEAISRIPRDGIAAVASPEGFPRALGPLLKQLDAEADTSAEQQQDGPEPINDDGSLFKFLPPAPVVLFCKNSPPFKKVVMQSQPIPTKSAPKSKESSGPAAPRASVRARTATDETSSGDVDEVLMPSTTLDVTTSKACDEPSPNVIAAQLQRLKALLSSPIETLVENSEEVKNILEEIQPHVPVTLQLKLWPVVSLQVKGAVGSSSFHADKCQRLNEKKAALDAKTDTSVSTAELEILRKELKDLEEKVRVTKELICDKEASIACSQKEAERLKAELKTDLAEIHALNKQLVAGKDDDDEAEIAEVDHVRAGALRALETFLQ